MTHPHRRRWLLGLALSWALLLAGSLTACGGGADEAPVIGPAGGVVQGGAGAEVAVPAGALAVATPVSIARSAQGAPAALPDTQAFGDTFAFTPHGTTFAAPVTVRIPFDAARVPAGVTPALFKTNAAGAWERVAGAVFAGGIATAQVSGFSWFSVGAQPPVIPASQQPQNVVVDEGQSAQFGVTALGAPPFAYQWERSNDGGSTWAALAGATARTLVWATTVGTPATAGGDDGARVRVIVSNPDGPTTSQAATLTVRVRVAAPQITGQPASASVVVGAQVAFNVGSSGPNLQHQWQRSTDAGATWADVAGALNASLIVGPVALADTGQRFRVRVSNAAGSVTSDAAELTVSAAPTGGASAGARIAAGGEVSFAVRRDGTVLSWGRSVQEGALGAGTAITRRGLPDVVPGITDVVALASGPTTVLAARRNGEVWGWGYNIFCQLSATPCRYAFEPLRYLGTPQLNGVLGLAAGSDHTQILRSDGVIEGAGWNATGALGQPQSAVYIASNSTPVPLVDSMLAVAAGSGFTVALRNDGFAWTWGSNTRGQTGHGSNVTVDLPSPVYGIDPVIAIAAGTQHVLAITRDGALWAWGDNTNGKLGLGGVPNIGSLMRVPVRTLATGPFTAVAAGPQHSIALHADGSVWAFGINETGQLGNGRLSPGFSDVPSRVVGLPNNIVAIAAGGGAGGLGHSLALAADGSVWAWGDNSGGQIGDGDASRIRATPVQVPGLNLN